MHTRMNAIEVHIYLQGNQGKLTSIGMRSARAQLVSASSGPAWQLLMHKMSVMINDEAVHLNIFHLNLANLEKEERGGLRVKN